MKHRMTQRIWRTARTAAVALWVWLWTERAAWAYLDPGTGSMVLQMILGGVAAFFFTIKLYWKKITGFFSGKKNPPQTPSKKSADS